MPKREQLTLYITKEAKAEELVPRLRLKAEEKRRTVNWMVLDAIRRYLKDPKEAP